MVGAGPFRWDGAALVSSALEGVAKCQMAHLAVVSQAKAAFHGNRGLPEDSAVDKRPQKSSEQAVSHFRSEKGFSSGRVRVSSTPFSIVKLARK